MAGGGGTSTARQRFGLDPVGQSAPHTCGPLVAPLDAVGFWGVFQFPLSKRVACQVEEPGVQKRCGSLCAVCGSTPWCPSPGLSEDGGRGPADESVVQCGAPRVLPPPPLRPAGPRLGRSPSHASFQEVTGNWGPLLDPTLSPCSRCPLFLLPLGVQQCPDSHSPSAQGDGGLRELCGKCASRRSHVRPQTFPQQEISRGALRGLS